MIFDFYFKKKYPFRVCLCVIGKKENLYVKEFVNHYKKLGYNHIYVYDNNDIDEEKFEDILFDEINKGYISIINFRGYRGKSEHPQFDAYYDCYKKNKKYYDWLSFFDFDEYLELVPNTLKINEFLENKRFNKCKNIKINWLIFTDNERLYYENKALKQRFLKSNLNDPANYVIKSTIKGKEYHNYWLNMNNPHSPNQNLISCDASGKRINSKDFFINKPNYRFAYIKHYATKTVEEFCKKIKRGRADLLLNLDKETLKERITYFFERNKKTKEKIKYIQRFFNINYENI